MPIAVPQYIVPGFAVAGVAMTITKKPQYTIKYRARDGRHYSFNGEEIELVARWGTPPPGVPRTFAQRLGEPDDIKTDSGCTLAATHPFSSGRNGLVFTVFGCATSIRPSDVVRVFESAVFVSR